MKLLLTFFLMFLSVNLPANSPPSPVVGMQPADILTQAKIDSMKTLPIHGLKMVKAAGQTFFMSDNGRFVITGTLLDVWNKKFITDIDQVEQIANRIDLAQLKLNIDDLEPVTVGDGKERVVVFVDPQCQYCLQVQQQIETLKKAYTFKLVMLPISGQHSKSLVAKLGCLSSDHPQKARNALMTHDYQVLDSLKDRSCNSESQLKARVTAHLFGIDAVPFLIAPDGRTFKGAPKNLQAWLEKSQKQQAQAEAKP